MASNPESPRGKRLAQQRVLDNNYHRGLLAEQKAPKSLMASCYGSNNSIFNGSCTRNPKKG